MEVDRRLESLPIPKAAGRVLDSLELRVQPFGDRIGDPLVQAVQDVVEVSTDNARDMDHRLEARANSPRLPALEEGPRRGGRLIVPDVPEGILRRPRARADLSALRGGAPNCRRLPMVKSVGPKWVLSHRTFVSVSRRSPR
jgi:hypothetical protein